MGVILTVFNAVNLVLPFRGFFALRRWWLRCCGIHVGVKTRVASGARFYNSYISIGDEAWIGPEVSLYSNPSGRITIGHRVDCAPGVMLVTGSHYMETEYRRAGKGRTDDIEVGDGTWIGARCVILGGATIGSGCIIAAGSVVIPGDYPDNVLLAGVPAQVKKTLPTETDEYVEE